ncbi:Cloroperoxidase [Sistotremastrum niveocremeum HHB9708]|uniref:Cloroperoxidase n=2 Tax=Sistotremastraceae TaxID=3402574 RepID=A0A164WKR5_9AGAM|nr:Cloroperoxidase [Sistotremastrum niveocremeum HHB9708]KZT40972.1 Cloroperoxidase [Sistotremastrum suecicum HHB10207 ss-3]
MPSTTSLVFLASSLFVPVALAFPTHVARSEVQDGQTGVKIKLPAPATDTSIKPIPDADHPFKAPGPNDLRGPCPGLNTMANHGYLPHNGIATFEQIIAASQEAFNMGFDLASSLAALAILGRGNAFINKVSIGGVTDKIPPLPFQIDGPVAGGLAKHGRFEGDISETRHDIGEGDFQNFQDDLYDEFLTYVGRFGGDSTVTGDASVVNLKVMQEFRWHRFQQEVASDENLVYNLARLSVSYNEAAFVITLFPGADAEMNTGILGSFFRNQTFPPNWSRTGTIGTFDAILDVAEQILQAHPVSAGRNINGQYVLDAPPNTGSATTDVHFDLMSGLSASLVTNTTGLLQENVQLLLKVLAAPFGADPTKQLPTGSPGQ